MLVLLRFWVLSVVLSFQDGILGNRLYLTPYIKKGEYQTARKLATVDPSRFKDILSYSGYFTVDNATDSHLFFWYFPAEKNPKTAPVVQSLQPGSALIGLFIQNGPLQLIDKDTVRRRFYSWHKDHHLLYIDSPVGTGFSTTKNGYVRSLAQVATHMYDALVQFFQMFPDLQNRPYFLIGQSDTGKDVLTIADAIHTHNPSAPVKINLAGMAVFNGFWDPVNQANYGEFLYNMGLIDHNQRVQMEYNERKIVDLLKNEQWHRAFEVWDTMINCAITNQTTLFVNFTGFNFTFNVHLAYNPSESFYGLADYLNKAEIREALHVGENRFSFLRTEPTENLLNEILQSASRLFSKLLSYYPIWICSGQENILIPYTGVLKSLKYLNFSAADEYKTAPRHIWKDGDDIAGYVKRAGYLTEVLVRNAGHFLPYDQPKRVLDLLRALTLGIDIL